MGVWRINKLVMGFEPVGVADSMIADSVRQLQRQIDTEVFDAIERFYSIPATKAIKAGLCQVYFNNLNRFHAVEDRATMTTICRWGMLDSNSVMDWSHLPHLRQGVELQFHTFDGRVSGKLINEGKV